jgi:RimJ/RimL family protein N-acetyltransferase
MHRESLSAPWAERITLEDGRELLLRRIEPLDAAPLRAGFALLTPEEVRMRFLHPMKELSAEMARRLTELDPTREFALVAAEPLPPGEALLGAVARIAVDNDGEHPGCNGEFAILVSRTLAGQGLGAHLMRRLLRWARLKRLDVVYGDVLDENTAMLELASSLGFRRELKTDEPGMIRISLALATAGR